MVGHDALTALQGLRVLVTGASGFIGCRLLAALRHSQAEVHAVCRRPPANNASGARWWQVDLAEPAAVRHLMTTVRADVIVHLASHVAGARDLALVMPTVQSILLSTVNLLTSAAEVGCQRFVLTGSLEEPSEPEMAPCSPYAAAKHAAAAYARMFQALFQVPTVILRLFMVYGPGQQDLRKLIPYVITSLLRGEAPQLMSGERPVDWIFVDDVVEALLSAATRPGAEGQTLDIGSGQLVPVRDVVEQLVKLVNPGITPRFGAFADRPFERVRVADVASTTRQIGWKPVTILADGLPRTVEWFAATSAGVRP